MGIIKRNRQVVTQDDYNKGVILNSSSNSGTTAGGLNLPTWEIVEEDNNLIFRKKAGLEGVGNAHFMSDFVNFSDSAAVDGSWWDELANRVDEDTITYEDGKLKAVSTGISNWSELIGTPTENAAFNTEMAKYAKRTNSATISGNWSFSSQALHGSGHKFTNPSTYSTESVYLSYEHFYPSGGTSVKASKHEWRVSTGSSYKSLQLDGGNDRVYASGLHADFGNGYKVGGVEVIGSDAKISFGRLKDTPTYYDSHVNQLTGFRPYSATGARWDKTAYTASDGVIEVGKYIDFHETNSNTSDYSSRITSASGDLYFSGAGSFEGVIKSARSINGTYQFLTSTGGGLYRRSDGADSIYLKSGTGTSTNTFLQGTYGGSNWIGGNLSIGKASSPTSGYACDINGNLRVVSAANAYRFNTTQVSQQHKIRLWGDQSTYSIGFGSYSSKTHGWVTEAYKMFFNMDGTAGRGWVFWNTSSDNAAMSVSNTGDVNIHSKLSFAGVTTNYLDAYGDGNNGALQWTNANGHFNIGTRNTAYCHMYTDRNSFYSYKPWYIHQGSSSWNHLNLLAATNGKVRISAQRDGGEKWLLGMTNATDDAWTWYDGTSHLLTLDRNSSVYMNGTAGYKNGLRFNATSTATIIESMDKNFYQQFPVGGSMFWRNGSSTILARMDSSGRLVLGSNSPDGKLRVISESDGRGSCFASSDNTAHTWFHYTNGGNYITNDARKGSVGCVFRKYENTGYTTIGELKQDGNLHLLEDFVIYSDQL